MRIAVDVQCEFQKLFELKFKHVCISETSQPDLDTICTERFTKQLTNYFWFPHRNVDDNNNNMTSNK